MTTQKRCDFLLGWVYSSSLHDRSAPYVEAAWVAVTKIGLAPGASTSRLRFESNLISKKPLQMQTIVYVDGFSGPWQPNGPELADSSFGVAVEATGHGVRVVRNALDRGTSRGTHTDGSWPIIAEGPDGSVHWCRSG